MNIWTILLIVFGAALLVCLAFMCAWAVLDRRDMREIRKIVARMEMKEKS